MFNQFWLHDLMLTNIGLFKSLAVVTRYILFALQIFGIYMIKDKDNVTLEDVLQPGTNMLAAGYCMYGSSCTVIIYADPFAARKFAWTLLPILTAVMNYGSLCWALVMESMASLLILPLESSFWLIQTLRSMIKKSCSSFFPGWLILLINVTKQYSYLSLGIMFYAFFLAQVPNKGKIYSVNEGNAKNWDGPTAKYEGSFLFKITVIS